MRFADPVRRRDGIVCPRAAGREPPAGAHAPTWIFHLATAEGPGGIALIEVLGEGAAEALARLVERRGAAQERRRRSRGSSSGDVLLGIIRDPSGEAIDEVLLSSIPAAASPWRVPGHTISSHGGVTIARRIRAALAAAGGEERDREGVIAFAVSRGALGRAEGDALARLPFARTERAAAYLLRLAAGELSSHVRAVLRALDDAGLDRARRLLEDLLRGAAAARALVEPRRVLLAGRPNAGKSTLFNRLAGKERAAVTPLPGTTRDLLEETVEIAGFPVVLVDSSGVRAAEEADDPVEREGIRRAREASAEGAVLFLLDRPGPPGEDEARFLAAIPPARRLLVRTKADLHGGARGTAPPGEAGWVSARTGEGLEELREAIRAAWLGPAEGDELPIAPVADRDVAALRAALAARSVDALRRALVECLPDPGREAASAAGPVDPGESA